ncbi:U6 snRNA-associated Sm-like protein LSm1 [Taphrina deformans PYCC 5710]|uniref:U6 snRNA-associated Sm-like protein LSm1 n=1 Tax=Taphrina deformans (strain PYCC 5710 / ATCC 11124 / CBS 356.35 / IMI 108563 / JCM 9778 / NBRC 8474) TaxID=1097556 RepID=R4X8X4_TAPDE|nr:U6 snRNA-associated Sm-like protein LSm1 [Taphrina deformans PYCC 5710]|eukprot:CCG81880.1 U6 snRNA-associated Sm-like protein LSm1 [Taphrina deformans PYCC 5710]
MDPLANSAFTTSGALIDCVDKKMVLVLRDNTKLFGVLRSFDQYGNLVLQDSYQRIYVDESYADVPKGVYLVRGENVVLMGELDIDEEDNIKQTRIEEKEANKRIAQENEILLRKERARSKTLHKLGFAELEEYREDLYLLH